MLIYEKPAETDEGIASTGSRTVQRLSDIILDSEDSEGVGSVLGLGGDTPCSLIFMNKSSRKEEYFNWSNFDLKIDLDGESSPKVLGDFPRKDFKSPIQWTMNKITYKAKNLADLRSKHDIIMEGAFQKKGRCHRWRNYFGLCFDTGLMLYFKKNVLRKVADFRRSTLSVPKSKKYRLDIEAVYVDNKPTKWLLKFDNEKHLNIWCETIAKVSKRQRSEIDNLQLSLDSPKN